MRVCLMEEVAPLARGCPVRCYPAYLPLPGLLSLVTISHLYFTCDKASLVDCTYANSCSSSFFHGHQRGAGSDARAKPTTATMNVPESSHARDTTPDFLATEDASLKSTIAKPVRPGHVYQNSATSENARAHYGDHIIYGDSHVYHHCKTPCLGLHVLIITVPDTRSAIS